MGDRAVSNPAVDPSSEGYRLFTIEDSLGQTALETNII
jgi:hypothetical protein